MFIVVITLHFVAVVRWVRLSQWSMLGSFFSWNRIRIPPGPAGPSSLPPNQTHIIHGCVNQMLFVFYWCSPQRGWRDTMSTARIHRKRTKGCDLWNICGCMGPNWGWTQSKHPGRGGCGFLGHVEIKKWWSWEFFILGIAVNCRVVNS